MDSTKLIASAIATAVIVGNSIAVAVWGKPIVPEGVDTANVGAVAASALTWLAEMTPSILTTIIAKTYVDNKTKQNVATIEAGTPTKEIAIAKAEAEIAVTKAVVAEPESEIVEPSAIPSTDAEWEAWKAKVKEDIDKENAAWINRDIGNPKYHITPDQARAIKPELSSDNPTMVWSKTQIRLMDTVKGNVQNNAEAIAAYEKALLPAAEAACYDAECRDCGSTNQNGINVCKWPASPFCKQWREWCNTNLASLKLIESKKAFDFKGYPAWYAGEIATSWVKKLSPMKTEYKEGKKIDIFFE